MPTTPATAELAHELRETLGRMVRRLRAQGGLPVSQVNVLGRLERNGPAGISELAAAEYVRPQSMAQTVRDLETADLVSRRPDPSDGRRVIIELTPAGTETILAHRAIREDWLTQALEREFDATERAQLEAAVSLLRRLASCG